MKNTRFAWMLVSLFVFASLLPAGCTEARAQSGSTEDDAPEPPRAERRARYDAILAGHDAALLATAELATADAACLDDEREWVQSPAVTFCTTLCQSDADCLEEDRCATIDLGVDSDGVTPMFSGEMEDGSAAAGMCNPFWDLDEAADENAELDQSEP